MAFLDWYKAYSVGVDSIDKQHIELLTIINEFHEKLHNGEGRAGLLTVFTKLKLFTSNHFAYEEKFMEEFGFEGFLEHKKEHDALIAQMVDLENRFNNGENALSYKVILFVKEWITVHMVGTDHKYSDFMIHHGLK